MEMVIFLSGSQAPIDAHSMIVDAGLPVAIEKLNLVVGNDRYPLCLARSRCYWALWLKLADLLAGSLDDLQCLFCHQGHDLRHYLGA